MKLRLRYILAAWLVVYLIGCVVYPEPDDTAWPNGGMDPAGACGTLPPLYGDDC